MSKLTKFSDEKSKLQHTILLALMQKCMLQRSSKNSTRFDLLLYSFKHLHKINWHSAILALKANMIFFLIHATHFSMNGVKIFVYFQWKNSSDNIFAAAPHDKMHIMITILTEYDYNYDIIIL